jgi:hypothetical protein
MLITLLLPTSGTATVLGLDVVRDAHALRRRIGYVFGGDRGLYERLSAYDNLRYFAELYGVSGHRQRARIEEVLELVGLAGREQERVEGYSRGMRQRLHIGRGIIHDPEIVANALSNLLEYPVWVATGLLFPIALLPGWVAPISWILAPTWGIEAIRHAALGDGNVWFPMAMCAVLGVAYFVAAAYFLRTFERLARARATLSLT